MDMSGSMAGSRIAAARTAATELVDILFGADELKALLKIGLVPWSGKVNVTLRGTTYSSATPVTVPAYGNPFAADTTKIYLANNSPVPLLSIPPAGWRGCVYARYQNDTNTTNDADLILGPALRGAETGLVGIDWPAWQPVGPEGEPGCSIAPFFRDCTRCLSHGITPVQGTKAGIQAAIEELQTPTGSTHAVAGLDWAWRVLMPDAPFTEADPNPEGRRTQAIVLLTDGEQTGNYGDAYKMAFGYNTAAQAGGQDQRLRDLAAIIKAQGVLIYAIQFGEPSTSLEALLKNVASGPDKPFYQKAPGAEELRAVFKEIANDLSQLRVSM